MDTARTLTRQELDDSLFLVPLAIEDKVIEVLTNRFGGILPEVIKDRVTQLLEFYPNYRKVDTPHDRTLDMLLDEKLDELYTMQMYTDRKEEYDGRRGCCGILGSFIDKLEHEYKNPPKKADKGKGKELTPLEAAAWNLKDGEFADFINDTSIPLADRVAIQEARSRKPASDEEIYIKKVSDTSIPLEKRLRLQREFNGLPDPKEVAAEEKRKQARMQNPDIAPELKLLTWLDENKPKKEA